MSVHLRFGTVSIRKLAQVAQKKNETWLNELIWRDFYHQILWHFPHIVTKSFKPAYDKIKWRNNETEFAAWCEGKTGYPIVDAAMRQMNQIGWMHNRARMIVASFLTKDLLIHWRAGDVYFMSQLIDGDPAANNGGWQWSAGTGTDAQPYFRIFNPVSQSKQFDPDGAYIRHYVPELRDVPDKFIHAPWEMPAPPPAYPAPVVEHSFARERTLSAFKAIKQKEPV